jgi:hypothetical protein
MKNFKVRVVLVWTTPSELMEHAPLAVRRAILHASFICVCADRVLHHLILHIGISVKMHFAYPTTNSSIALVVYLWALGAKPQASRNVLMFECGGLTLTCWQLLLTLQMRIWQKVV